MIMNFKVSCIKHRLLIDIGYISNFKKSTFSLCYDYNCDENIRIRDRGGQSTHI